ncbi:MAG TPA: thioesterase [Gammaproteobacteria bacterium]|jgi:acyl-coenzyme A thioesterase PaaI-like protein|nr:thioesterase [Gammaproteobacteria bacterium]HAT25679.1 thioesterase [Gammaproteobacteria bacterium]HIF87618.1 PaaI family thioesterase [Gammaproteobacteria bacterium]HIL62573.1 PaaI family thioesterase [Porticoccaceae bacterium]|tara:strand:- start:8599 stop:9000 length:402 start_codon:yes stop_codon:yes gene_type:complete
MNELQADGNNCFVCGRGNSRGLKLVFRIENELCRSEFTPAAHHCGYNGVTHGGIIFSVLDDVMANWIFLKGIRAFTAKCDIRYRDSLPTGITVALEGRCIKQRGRLIVMQGSMIRTDTNELVAETQASFMVAA